MAAVSRRAALALLLCAAGCGDPLLDERFRGAPRWTFRADVLSATPGTEVPGRLRAAFFFAPDLHGLDPDGWRELTASAIPVTAPSYNVLHVFEPPGPDLLVAGTDYGVARLLVYDDADGSGRREAGEPIVALQGVVGWVYNGGPLDGAHTHSGRPLEAGFRHVFLPQSCGEPPPGPTTPGTCGVPLGAACLNDIDCRGGVCLESLGLPVPGGYCVVPEPPPRGCRPADAVYLRRPPFIPGAPMTKGYWVRPCTADADCRRPGDPDDLRYACDAGLRACLPSDAPVLVAGSAIRIAPFCAGDVTR